MDIIHTENGDGVVLVYSFMLVKITGKNLDELIDHIAQGDVLFIQKFDAGLRRTNPLLKAWMW